MLEEVLAQPVSRRFEADVYIHSAIASPEADQSGCMPNVYRCPANEEIAFAELCRP